MLLGCFAKRVDGADLSQRDLAQRAVGARTARSSRIESGETAEPQIRDGRAATAGGRLRSRAAVRPGQARIVPTGSERDRAERDRAGRRYPAHLDVRPVTTFGTWWGDWQLLSTLAEKAWYLSPRQRPEHTFDLARWRRDERRRGGYARPVTDHQHATSDPDLRHADPEIADLVAAEAERQRDTVRLIASENYVSAAVLEATGTVLTNKYSEGYAGKRYYEGQQVIDQVETLADRAGQGAVRRRARQRAALLRLARQPRRLPGLPRSPATPSWAWRCRSAATSPTAGACRPPASGSARCSTASRQDTGRVDMDEVRDLALARAAEADLLRRHRDPAHHRLPGASPRSPARSAPSWSPTSRTSPAWSPAARTPRRSATPTSSPRPPTRPCAARAAP